MADILAAFGGSLARAPWGWALLAVVLLALIRVWPILALQAIKAKEQLRGENRADLRDCNKRCDELTEKFHQLEMKLVGAITAYKILDVECEALDPGSTALGQARAAMSAAFAMSPSTPFASSTTLAAGGPQ